MFRKIINWLEGKPADENGNGIKNCSTCKYWEKIEGDLSNNGFCHRYAPPPISTETKRTWSLPIVRDGWCGDYLNGKFGV